MSEKSSSITYDNSAANQEYFVASEHYKQAVTYRFTSLGLMLAGVTFLLGKDTQPLSGLIGVLILVPIWIIELRNRVIILTIAKRMIEIEKSWKRTSEATHFMTLYHAHDLDHISKARIKPWILMRKGTYKRLLISHSFGIDVIIIILIAACVLKCLSISPFDERFSNKVARISSTENFPSYSPAELNTMEQTANRD